MNIQIKTVKSKSDLMDFIKMQWLIYKNDPNWVPPLIMDRKKLLNREKNPFYKHAEMEMFLAYKNNEIVGRIAAIKNDSHNKVHNDKVGFFGFFECIDDQEVADTLFDSAKNWLKSKGLDAMRGPANPSSNDEYGMLIEGFDDPPRILMTYNPEYYLKLCENYGLKKEKDLFAYKISKERLYTSDKIFRVQEIARQRYKVSIRKLNKKKLNDEVKIVKEIYNKAWEPNWGFVPLNDEEMDALANDLKPLADEDVTIFAESEGKTIGFALALPDYNFIFKEMNGKLFPFNFLKLFTKKKSIKWLRIIILGVIPEYQKKGIDSILYTEIVNRAKDKGIYLGEASWILEDNEAMIKGAAVMNGELYKKYRIYQMPV